MVAITVDDVNSVDIRALIAKQRDFFATGKTKDYNFRVSQMQKLAKIIAKNENLIFEAIHQDLRKPATEAFTSEIFCVLSEIEYVLKHLKTWMKPQKVGTPLTFFPSSSFIYPEPLGVVLIIAPWNYPFALMIQPLIGAIAAGNCAILKPSEQTPHTSKAIAQIINNNFDASFIAAIEGGIDINQALLAEKFDHIFFTGGTAIGKIVMESAAKHLNLLVQKNIKSALIEKLLKSVKTFYGEDPQQSPDLARIVNYRQFDRLVSLLDEGKILVGGQNDRSDRFIAPTLIDDVSPNSKIMSEEIFGPILPILEYDQLSEAIAFVKTHPKPLALYFFSNNKQNQERILQEISYGGGCFNDSIVHYVNLELPFGGVGDSGIGSYHGKSSFDTFSHRKSVLKNSFRFDIKLRYPPYTMAIATLKKFIK